MHSEWSSTYSMCNLVFFLSTTSNDVEIIKHKHAKRRTVIRDSNLTSSARRCRPPTPPLTILLMWQQLLQCNTTSIFSLYGTEINHLLQQVAKQRLKPDGFHCDLRISLRLLPCYCFLPPCKQRPLNKAFIYENYKASAL